MKKSGIVASESKWDTSAMPAAAEVSLPYDAGTTIEFSPNGIAETIIIHLKTVSGTGMSENIPNIIKGIITRRMTVAI